MINCGSCKKQFKTDKGYCNHKCEVLGFKPTDPRIMGEHYEKIQNAALKRGKGSAK